MCQGWTSYKPRILALTRLDLNYNPVPIDHYRKQGDRCHTLTTMNQLHLSYGGYQVPHQKKKACAHENFLNVSEVLNRIWSREHYESILEGRKGLSHSPYDSYVPDAILLPYDVPLHHPHSSDEARRQAHLCRHSFPKLVDL